jgi:hypothetical protein
MNLVLVLTHSSADSQTGFGTSESRPLIKSKTEQKSETTFNEQMSTYQQVSANNQMSTNEQKAQGGRDLNLQFHVGVYKNVSL